MGMVDLEGSNLFFINSHFYKIEANILSLFSQFCIQFIPQPIYSKY